MSEKVKSKIYFGVFIVAAGILAWGFWNNYRPQIILASCSDIADRSIAVEKRSSIEQVDYKHSQVLHNCLNDAGLEK